MALEPSDIHLGRLSIEQFRMALTAFRLSDRT
jgi:hypothetical protein